MTKNTLLLSQVVSEDREKQLSDFQPAAAAALLSLSGACAGAGAGAVLVLSSRVLAAAPALQARLAAGRE